MQNTIFKAYENDPRVVMALLSQSDEGTDIQTFWTNYYLRGQVLYDPTGHIGRDLYSQPLSGVPFSRGWIIDTEQNVVLPLFGYDPDRIMATIDELLADMPAVGDVTGDGVIDVLDLLAVLLAWGDCPASSACPADVDGDGMVSVGDLILVVTGWS
ncbi:MAG: hypothetical protein ACYTGR_04255 [Planctomycetota bacterium]|jgi:hypothetical protein